MARPSRQTVSQTDGLTRHVDGGAGDEAERVVLADAEPDVATAEVLALGVAAHHDLLPGGEVVHSDQLVGRIRERPGIRRLGAEHTRVPDPTRDTSPSTG